eukprot:scaffold17243_cov61-Phaeocystis_antarctica.AAC.2
MTGRQGTACKIWLVVGTRCQEDGARVGVVGYSSASLVSGRQARRRLSASPMGESEADVLEPVR